MKNKDTIDHTNKVSLVLKLFPASENKRPIDSAVFEFIYGIGTFGLCPLELALVSKSVGDEMELTVGADGWRELFGHLAPPRFENLPTEEKWRVEMKIIAVAPCDSREIIQALAHMTGCSGGCGCGCGGH